MQFLHAMVRVRDLDAALDFFCDKLGLFEVSRIDNEGGRFTLVFLAAPDDADRAKAEKAPTVELTYNWDPEDYGGARNFGHLAYAVDDIYSLCHRLMDKGVTIELLQKGARLPPAEPWASMANTGAW
jgi:lactoylglutathione lyase